MYDGSVKLPLWGSENEIIHPRSLMNSASIAKSIEPPKKSSLYFEPTPTPVQYFNPNPVPVVQPIIQIPKADDLTQYYAICDKDGPCEPDNDFNIDAWKEFYPPNDPFFLYVKGPITPNYMVYNPQDPTNLAIYEGEMKGRLKHGFGRLTTSRYVRLGMWRDDHFTGWGRESRRNGDVLEGRFIEGRVNGKGILKNKKGNLYVGDFVDSKREGLGDLDTNSIHYKGEFRNDKLNGRGAIHFKNSGHYFEGDFKDNEICGKGIFKWKNGDIYEGEMSLGKMNGYGKYTYATGEVYEGNYVNGSKEGRGKLQYRNGKVFDGEFIQGKPGGEGSITEGGNIYPVRYSSGAFNQI